LHARLSDWADALLVLPVGAALLADIALGHPGDPSGGGGGGDYGGGGCLAARLLRVWDPAKPVLLCPGLTRQEERGPATGRHLALLAVSLPSATVLPRLEDVAGVSSGPESGGGDEGTPSGAGLGSGFGTGRGPKAEGGNPERRAAAALAEALLAAARLGRSGHHPEAGQGAGVRVKGESGIEAGFHAAMSDGIRRRMR
jgi:hypothetical protein